jgi:hypothetical protein
LPTSYTTRTEPSRYACFNSSDKTKWSTGSGYEDRVLDPVLLNSRDEVLSAKALKIKRAVKAKIAETAAA